MASYEQLTKDNWKVTVSLGYDTDGKQVKKENKGLKEKKMLKNGLLNIKSKNIKDILLQLKAIYC